MSSAPRNQVTKLSLLVSSGVLVGLLSRGVWACADWDGCSASQRLWCHWWRWISPWHLQTGSSLATFVDQPRNISGPATHAQTVVSRAWGWHVIRRGEKQQGLGCVHTCQAELKSFNHSVCITRKSRKRRREREPKTTYHSVLLWVLIWDTYLTFLY